MIDGGRVGFLIKGLYDPNVMYDFLDIVFYQGCSYVAKRKVKGIAPQYDSDDWKIFATGTMTVDQALSFDSSNPVSNKAIVAALDGLATKDMIMNMQDIKMFDVEPDPDGYADSLHVFNPYFPGWIPNKKDVMILRNTTPGYIRANQIVIQGQKYYTGMMYSLSNEKIKLEIPPYSAMFVGIDPESKTFYFHAELFDGELSSTSVNGVQNKVIFKRFADHEDWEKMALAAKAEQSDYDEVMARIDALEGKSYVSKVTKELSWALDDYNRSPGYGDKNIGCFSLYETEYPDDVEMTPLIHGPRITQHPKSTSTYIPSHGYIRETTLNGVVNYEINVRAPLSRKISSGRYLFQTLTPVLYLPVKSSDDVFKKYTYPWYMLREGRAKIKTYQDKLVSFNYKALTKIFPTLVDGYSHSWNQNSRDIYIEYVKDSINRYVVDELEKNYLYLTLVKDGITQKKFELTILNSIRKTFWTTSPGEYVEYYPITGDDNTCYVSLISRSDIAAGQSATFTKTVTLDDE